MNVFIRLALAILFLDELIVGASNALVPASFYHRFPTVDLTPPFSEHYARDFGDATLGIALLLGIALVRPRAHFAIPAALAYSVFSLPHFVFHLLHMEGASPAEAVGRTAANAIVAILGIGIVVAVILRDRRAATGGWGDIGRTGLRAVVIAAGESLRLLTREGDLEARHRPAHRGNSPVKRRGPLHHRRRDEGGQASSAAARRRIVPAMCTATVEATMSTNPR